MCFVRDKVNVTSFVVPFKGKFARKCFNSPFPPKMEFPNNPICAQFEEFISSTIIDRVKNGSLVFWGRVGQVEAPHLVMPITVEPSKPRICHDERFLNLWIKDCHFSLDYLSDLLRYIGSGHYQTVVMTKVAMTIFVFPPPAGPYLDSSGRPVISCTIPSPSGGRRVRMCITQLVYWQQVI